MNCVAKHFPFRLAFSRGEIRLIEFVDNSLPTGRELLAKSQLSVHPPLLRLIKDTRQNKDITRDQQGPCRSLCLNHRLNACEIPQKFKTFSKFLSVYRSFESCLWKMKHFWDFIKFLYLIRPNQRIVKKSVKLYLYLWRLPFFKERSEWNVPSQKHFKMMFLTTWTL